MTQDTNVSKHPELTKYVTQEEMDLHLDIGILIIIQDQMEQR